MKLVNVFFMVMFSTFSLTGQDLLNWGYSGAYINFENLKDSSKVLINNPSVWTISTPQKNILFLPQDQQIANQNAIFSGPTKYYDNNLKASFQFKLKYWGGDGLYFGFTHKYDFQQNKDGGIVEISHDNGKTWSDILEYIKKNAVFEYQFGFYTSSDTISSNNKKPGFTGLQSEMYNVSLCFDPSNNYQEWKDTILVRFTISSDNLNANNEGWMIDEIYFDGYLKDGIEDINGYSGFRMLYDSKHSVIQLLPEQMEILSVKVYNLYGKEILVPSTSCQINMNGIPKGIYFVQINNHYTKKIII